MTLGMGILGLGEPAQVLPAHTSQTGAAAPPGFIPDQWRRVKPHWQPGGVSGVEWILFEAVEIVHLNY